MNTELDNIISTLRSDTLEELWQEALSWSPDLEETEKEKGLAWIREEREEFIRRVSAVDDTVDRKMIVAVRYIELKCAWTQVNTMNNYEMVNKGTSDPVQIMKSGLLSQLLANLEALLDVSDLENITEFLNRPIKDLM